MQQHQHQLGSLIGIQQLPVRVDGVCLQLWTGGALENFNGDAERVLHGSRGHQVDRSCEK